MGQVGKGGQGGIRSGRAIRALISIHDVMPETLDSVEELLGMCEQRGLRKVTLLVVPGLAWSDSQLEMLRNWSMCGYQLAGHGWVHRCENIVGIEHRLHSWLISRNVAEHLSMTSAEIVDLIQRCAAWFEFVGLEHRGLYVPPAWALGRLSFQELNRLPFEMIEVLGGVLRTRTGLKRSLPLVGYEADTLFRRMFVSGFNWFNQADSRLRDRPLRISIHPFDHRLRLAGELERMLSSRLSPIYYDEL